MRLLSHCSWFIRGNTAGSALGREGNRIKTRLLLLIVCDRLSREPGGVNPLNENWKEQSSITEHLSWDSPPQQMAKASNFRVT
jgi:hypothetical protein